MASVIVDFLLDEAFLLVIVQSTAMGRDRKDRGKRSWRRPSSFWTLMRSGCGSWKPRCRKRRYLVGPEKPFLKLASHSLSPRQEGQSEMTPVQGLSWVCYFNWTLSGCIFTH